MTMTCKDCSHCGLTKSPTGDIFECQFIPPATLFVALGINHPHEVAFSTVYPDWSCALFESHEECVKRHGD